MSQQITQAFVDQFTSNIFHLSQQKGSRLRASVRNESQTGKSAFYERLGSAVAIKKTGRHSDTPQIDTPHSRRRVTLEDYIYADLIDEEDKIRMLIDPQSPYSQAAMWSLGRAMDDVLITAMRGNAFSGEDGSTTVALPAAQQIWSNFDNAGTFEARRLNVDALRRAKKVFDQADVDPSIRRYIAVNAEQLESLLAETEVTSSDFNTVRALVRGEINEFLGFTFIQTQRLNAETADIVDATGATADEGAGDTTITDADRVLAWAEDGVLLSVGRDMSGRIDPRPDKNYAMQIFASMGIGGTRLEDEKVVEIFCKPTA